MVLGNRFRDSDYHDEMSELAGVRIICRSRKGRLLAAQRGDPKVI
jgi:hypothetical protein